MLGVLAGLEEAATFDARKCDAFVGTSAGSIVAAALAAGVSPRARLDRFPQQPAVADGEQATSSFAAQALRLGRAARGSAFGPLASLALWSAAAGGAVVRRTALARIPRGRRSLDGLRKMVDELGAGWDGRLLVTAVELESGKRVVFGERGESRLTVGEAVQASCSIPGVFRPLHKGESTYVDGGAWSLTNLDAAPVERGTRVLCLNPTGTLLPFPTLRGALGPVSRGVAAVEAMPLQRRGAKVDAIAPDTAAVAAMGSNFMDAGKRSAAQAAGVAQGVRLAAGHHSRAA